LRASFVEALIEREYRLGAGAIFRFFRAINDQTTTTGGHKTTKGNIATGKHFKHPLLAAMVSLNLQSFTLIAVISVLSRYVDASIISTSDARLPMSLSTIISDLEAEGCSEVSTFCLITSHSVTKQRQVKLLDAIVGSSTEDHAGLVIKAAGTTTGLAVGQPDASEVALTACACGGKIVYYADATDLARGEGLFDTLAPALEKLLGTDSQEQSKLIVVVDDQSQVEAVKASLEKAAESIIKTLISERPVSSLQEIFSQVLYVTQEDAANVVSSEPSTNPSDAMSKIAELVSQETMLLSTSFSSASLSSENLAAARILGPTARVVLSKAVAQVTQACQDNENEGSYKLVSSFGELCDAAIQMALRELESGVADCPSLLQSNVGKQIYSNLQAELYAELGDFFDTQLELLQVATTDDFKKAVSKLLVSPNLGKDMDELVDKTVAAFAKAAGKLLPKGSHKWNSQPAKQMLRAQLKEFCTKRLTMARASGQYKPLPRKGVTVGMHWLLPKPFGNDFRQEPWMVHATDGMVYIPRDKITEVSPEEARSGSWLNKLVPAPAANEMIYMQ
jgi:hypothetical protein